MKKQKLTQEEKQEIKRAERSFNHIVAVDKKKGALIEVTTKINKHETIQTRAE